MDKPLDIPGLAEYLDISPETVKLRVKRREWPFTRIPGGNLVRFTPEHVAAILSAGEQPALNGPLAGPTGLRLATGPRPPAGPSTPPPPSGPATPSKQRGRAA